MRVDVSAAGAFERSAKGLLAGHFFLIAFSTLAMVTILAGAFPAFMQGPYTQTVYELGWRYSGQVYITLGALAALAHSAPRFGAARALGVAAVATAIALASELGGTNVGLPFGPYRYTEMLGYRILGDVPYAIPISWYYMLYASLAIVARVRPADDSGLGRWRWAIIAGAVLTAWDVAMEVQMTNVAPAHWVWELDRVPAWVPAWLVAPVFHGMPISNWIGWYLTAVLASRAMLALAPPTLWARTVAPSRLPVLLYAANALMPVAVTARHGFVWAAAAGLLAMGIPVALALRSPRRAGQAAEPPPSPPAASARVAA